MNEEVLSYDEIGEETADQSVDDLWPLQHGGVTTAINFDQFRIGKQATHSMGKGKRHQSILFAMQQQGWEGESF